MNDSTAAITQNPGNFRDFLPPSQGVKARGILFDSIIHRFLLSAIRNTQIGIQSDGDGVVSVASVADLHDVLAVESPDIGLNQHGSSARRGAPHDLNMRRAPAHAQGIQHLARILRDFLQNSILNLCGICRRRYIL